MKHLLLLFLFLPQLSFGQSCQTMGEARLLADVMAASAVKSTSTACLDVRFDIDVHDGFNVIPDVNLAISAFGLIGIQINPYFFYYDTLTYKGTRAFDVWSPYANWPNGRESTHDAHLLITKEASGGLASVDALGTKFSRGMASLIDLPGLNKGRYSNPLVIAHELGHIIWSPHTQQCGVWLDDLPLDDCIEVECGPGPPTEKGTIMSYCHLNVGSDFRFHEQPATGLLAAAVGYSGECSIPPPPCENIDSFRITFDSHPREITWSVGRQSGGPWPKNTVSENVEFCLLECDTIFVFDSAGDGMQSGCDAGFVTYAGVSYEFSGGVLAIPTCEAPYAPCVDLSEMAPFSNQARGGVTSVVGENVSQKGNVWSYVPIKYTITENTVITFDVYHNGLGEIHGLAFPINNTPQSSRSLKFGGRQRYGYSYPIRAGAWVNNVTIRLSEYFVGYAESLVFINDGDSGATGGTFFRNICIEEQNVVTNPNTQTHHQVDALGRPGQGVIQFTNKGVTITHEN